MFLCVLLFFFLQEAAINTLVGVEIAMWFFVGEVIGKRTLLGYQVHPAASHFELEF